MIREAFARLHPMDAMRLKNTSGSVDTTFAQQRLDLFSQGWQACAEEKDKRIFELSAENNRCHIQITKNTFNAIERNDELRKLTAQNKELVEALEACKYDCHTGEVIAIAKEALAKVKGE